MNLPLLHVSFQISNLRHGQVAEQLVIAEHELIADRQHLAEYIIGRLGDTDIISQRLAHLVDPVQTFQKRHSEDNLWFLVFGALQISAHKQVKQLVRTADFYIGLQGNRVIALDQWIKKLMNRDRAVRLKPFLEIIPLKHTGNGQL